MNFEQKMCNTLDSSAHNLLGKITIILRFFIFMWLSFMFLLGPELYPLIDWYGAKTELDKLTINWQLVEDDPLVDELYTKIYYNNNETRLIPYTHGQINTIELEGLKPGTLYSIKIASITTDSKG